MASKAGSDIVAGIKIGSTYGTAVAVGSGDKLVLEDISPSQSVTTGSTNAIGGGDSMEDSVDTLKTDDSISITQQARYDDSGLTRCLALLLGDSTAVPAEANVGEGDYEHTIIWDSDANEFATVAFEGTSTEVFEYPSCYCQSVSIESGETPGYLTYTAEFLPDSRVLNSSTNTTASLGSATVGGDQKVVHTTSDYFWINALADGALDSGDAICPETVSISYNYPRIKKNCFGGSAVLVDGLLEVTVTLSFYELADFTFFTAQDAGTEYKAVWNIQGSQIGAGDNFTYEFRFPKLKVIESPDYSVSDSGVNPYTVVLKGLAASSAPTGFSSVYPSVYVVNDNSAAII